MAEREAGQNGREPLAALPPELPPMFARMAERLAPPPKAHALPRDFDRAPGGDHILNPGSRLIRPGPLTPAAVLVPLIEQAGNVTMLFTRRNANLSSHSGQISFPGGRVEPEDEDLAACALRETEEEIGLARSHVRVLGALDPYVVRSGFVVMPIVALVSPGFSLVPDPREVDEIFEVPLDFLLDPRNHQRHSGTTDGVERHWWAMPYGEYYIWGATAGMLRNFYERVSGDSPVPADIAAARATGT